MGEAGHARKMPIHRNRWIIPGDATLECRGVKNRGFVEEFGGLAQRDKAVGKLRRISTACSSLYAFVDQRHAYEDNAFTSTGNVRKNAKKKIAFPLRCADKNGKLFRSRS